MNDIFGQALLDYYFGNYTEDIMTETNITTADEMPLPYLFRSFDEMPKLEQMALEKTKGCVLDVGCGAGNHALYLQKKGHDVTAIDISAGAVEVTKLRGVKNVKQSSLLDFSGKKFDTILLLMNGTGIFGRLDNVPLYLAHLSSLLADDGQILIDSSDLAYMYDRNEDGSIWVPEDRYYGELDFTMSYKNKTTEKFPWLYIHEALFKSLCEKNGLSFHSFLSSQHPDSYLSLLKSQS